MFNLALTFGLETDPLGALQETVGFIEATARRHGIEDAVQATFGVSDGETVWAVRYATAGTARSLFVSADVDAVRRLHPQNPRFQRMRADDRLIVSEPFSDLPGVWQEVPDATAVTAHPGGILSTRPFTPRTSRSQTVTKPNTTTTAQ